MQQASVYFWLAGKMHSKQGHGYHAAVSFRRAISASASLGQSLAPDELRKALPLTSQERDANLDVMEVIETAAKDGYTEHKKVNPQFPQDFVLDSTDDFMLSSFEAFARELAVAGNHEESIMLGIRASERRRRRYIRKRDWLPGLAYGFWSLSSNYGTDYLRWLATVVFTAWLYACAYWSLKVIKPLTDFINPFYFSIVTMTTVGYGDIQPVGNLEMLACSEIFFGLAMFGILVGIISRRIIKS